MASVAPAADQATDLSKKLSLDPMSKANQAPAAEEAAGAPDAVPALQPAVASTDGSVTPTLQDYKDSSMYYGAYPVPCYYAGYGGWGDYSTYVSLDGVGTPTPGAYGDMYCYAPYGVAAPGHDGQMYGSQLYPYPSTYHQPQITASKPAHSGSNNTDDVKSLKKTTLPLKPSGRSAGYQNQTSKSAYPWYGGQIYSDRQQRLSSSNPISTVSNAKNKGGPKNQNLRPLPHLTGLHGPASPASPMGPSSPGITSSIYPGNGMSNGSAYGSGLWYRSHIYGSGLHGGWNALSDGKYNPRGKAYGSYGFRNGNLDGLNELKRGPRSGLFKNQQGFGAAVVAPVKGQELPTSDGSNAIMKDHYNQADFIETYSDAKFFIIKSYSEDDVHKSIKYNVWASTPNGNKKLNTAYEEAKEKSSNTSVFLLFSVNTSGQFVGLSEMVGPVDFSKTVEYWQQDKWTGCFPVKWHIVKDISNSLLKHIILENNENKPVTNSRDTQEVKLEQGLQMLKIFKDHVCKTSILDDFSFYDNREKIMLDRKSKQQQPLKKVMNAKLLNANCTEKEMLTGKLRLQKLGVVDILRKESVHGQVGEQISARENSVAAVAVNGVATKDTKLATEEFAVANDC